MFQVFLVEIEVEASVNYKMNLAIETATFANNKAVKEEEGETEDVPRERRPAGDF